MTQVSTTITHDNEGRAWVEPDFRRLWMATAVSRLGSEMGELALPLLAIITLSASAGELGILRTTQFLPFLVATLPFGVLVDRVPKRHLMIISDLGRFVLVALIPILVWLGITTIEWYYALVFVAGLFTVLYQLADFAYLPLLVSRSQIIDANGKLTATQSGNEIAGKGIGGMIVEWLTAPMAVLFDAMTYLISALNLLRIERIEPPRLHTATHRSALADGVEGLTVALRNRFIRPLLGEATTFNFFNEIFIIGLLLYTVREIRLGPILLGLVFVAGGLGSVLGAWFGARVTGRFGYGRVLLTTLILGNAAPMSVLLLHSNAAPAVTVLGSGFLVMGVGIGIANVHAVTLRQIAIPEHLRGRVNAGYRLISWGALPLGALLGGILAESAGPYNTTLIGAIGIASATLWVLFSPIPKLRAITDAIGG
ncbi:MAG: MFS transporter [Acidimicrobiia bacterium]|nr:MFS transporter [Acidimicrobiia bacterium]